MKSAARHITSPAAIFAILVSLTIIGYWIFVPQSHINYADGGIVKFNTALCMGLSGLALLFLNNTNHEKTTGTLAFTCLFIVTLISLLTIGSHVLGINTGLDQLFVKEINPAPRTAPGRMSLSGAVLYLMFCAAMYMLHYPRLHMVVQVLLIVAFVFLALLLFLYAAQPTPIKLLTRPTAVYTILGLLSLFIGGFFSKPLQYLKFSLQKRIAAFISFAILFIVVVFFSFVESAKQIRATPYAVERTNLSRDYCREILEAALNVETGTRGFILSQNQEFLEPFNKGIYDIYRSYDHLRSVKELDSVSAPRLDTLKRMIDENVRLRSRQIEMVKSNRFDEVQKIFEEGTNKLLMDSLRAVIDNILSDENRLLARHKEVNESTVSGTFRVIVVFKALTALLLVFAFIAIINNVRSRNRAEQQIRELNQDLEKKVEQKSRELVNSELHFRNILDNLLEGVQIIGFDWKYKYVNDSFLTHAKYKREELVGFTVMDKYPGIEETEIYKVYQKCFNERIPIHLENEFTYPDGSMGWFELSFQPVPEGIFILSMDISERKRSEIRMLEMNRILDKRAAELESSNAELERFAYVASHDLQEPLRMVSSFLHLLERKLGDNLDPTYKQYINFAVDGAERMKTLIQDLLQYSRVGTSKENITNVDCNEVMETVRSVLSLSIHETNARITVHQLPVIKAANAQVLQLFQNLVSNAIKYRGDKTPVIEVGCRDKGSKWEFYVSDNGIGIDPKFFDKIFIIFQRLHNKSEYSGTGIGLAICRKIVEKHGGRLWVESTLNEGSTFYFTFPKSKV